MRNLPEWAQFWLDVFFASLFILSLIWAINNISQLGIFDVFDPIGEALGDMETSDLAMSQLREDPEVNQDITLVNVGNLSRAEIAMQLNIINSFNPKVVGIDVFFDVLKDTLGDLALADALNRTENLVMVSRGEYTTEEIVGRFPDSVHLSHPLFRSGAHLGFANLETEAKYQEDYKSCRRFPPTLTLFGKEEHAFAIRLAQAYDSAATQKFLDRDQDWEVINYRGNIPTPYANTKFIGFFALDVGDVMTLSFDSTAIKDKIVILGFLGDSFLDPSWGDKFYTPLNQNYVGRANPDMYGAVIHANIAAMILNDDPVDELSGVQSVIIGLFLMIINVALFSLIYKRLPRWYDGITKVTQVVEILVILFIIIYVFSFYSLKINLTLGLAAVALAGDSLEVYYGVIKNLFSARQRRLLFRVNRSDEID